MTDKLLTPRPSVLSRTGWCPLVCKNGDTFQVRILCQRINNQKSLYSSAPPASASRPTWAPIVDCRVVVDPKANDDTKFVYSFVNLDNEVKPFSVELFNPLMHETNPFTQTCAGLIVERKVNLIGHYFALTSRSEGFCTHTESYDNHGFSTTDPCGLKIEDLVNEGGSLEDLQRFQALAKEHAFVFDKGPTGERDLRLSSLNKRKITDFFKTPPNKMTKKDKIENSFREEMEDEIGLEVKLKNSFVNFKMVSIDRLKVSDKLYLQKDESKVRELTNTMAHQFDPSQIILTVCPENLDEYEKADKIDQLEFLVVAGQHRLAALKELDRLGKLENLPGIKNRKIPCYVCTASSAASTNYANIRSNDTSSKFKTTANNEDLLFIYFGLLKASEKPHEALDVVKRICYSRQTHPEDIAALVKIIDWPADVLSHLLGVLEKFQKYQTLDATGYGTKSRLKNGVKKSLTKAQFRLLGRCKPEYFNECHGKVLGNKISLRELLEQSQHVKDLERTQYAVVQIAGHETFEKLVEKFPDKFSEGVLVKYIGAEVYGKKKNDLGKLLENYVKSVIEKKKVKENVMMEPINSVFDLDGPRLEEFDVIIFSCDLASWNVDFVKYLADFAGYSRKNQLSVMIIPPNGALLFQVFQALEVWKENPHFKINQILFKKSTGVPKTGVIQENVTFCLLFGTSNIFSDDLNTLQNGPVQSELIKVVHKVSPESSKVAYISAGEDIMKIHDTHSGRVEREVTYFARKRQLDKFSSRFLLKVQTVSKKQEVGRDNSDSDSGDGEIIEADDVEKVKDVSRRAVDKTDNSQPCSSGDHSDEEPEDAGGSVITRHDSTSQF